MAQRREATSAPAAGATITQPAAESSSSGWQPGIGQEADAVCVGVFERRDALHDGGRVAEQLAAELFDQFTDADAEHRRARVSAAASPWRSRP